MAGPRGNRQLFDGRDPKGEDVVTDWYFGEILCKLEGDGEEEVDEGRRQTIMCKKEGEGAT